MGPERKEQVRQYTSLRTHIKKYKIACKYLLKPCVNADFILLI